MNYSSKVNRNDELFCFFVKKEELSCDKERISGIIKS